MTTEQRRDDEATPTSAPASDDKSKPASPSEPQKPAGLNYVFKFAPADPKNSFDFEDVADK